LKLLCLRCRQHRTPAQAEDALQSPRTIALCCMGGCFCNSLGPSWTTGALCHCCDCWLVRANSAWLGTGGIACYNVVASWSTCTQHKRLQVSAAPQQHGIYHVHWHPAPRRASIEHQHRCSSAPHDPSSAVPVPLVVRLPGQGLHGCLLPIALKVPTGQTLPNMELFSLTNPWPGLVTAED
jgi:hypothetical protein